MEDAVRLEFNRFVVRLSKAMTQEVEELLKTLWNGVISQKRLQNTADLINCLLEREHISLYDVKTLKDQFKDPLNQDQLVTMCEDYETKVRSLKQDHDRLQDLSNLHISSDSYCTENPDTENNIVKSVTGAPVQESRCYTLRNILAIPGQDIFELSSPTSQNPVMCNTPAYSRESSMDPMESEDCQSCHGTSEQGSPADMHVASTLLVHPLISHKQPETPSNNSVSSLNGNEKCGLQEYPQSVSFQELCISGEPLWSEKTLKKFVCLEDFRTAEIEELHEVMKNIGVPVEGPTLLRVNEFFCKYQRHPSLKQGLRKITECLKSLNRYNIIEAMHHETSLLRYLGPKQEESLCIKDMPFTKRFDFTVAFSVEKSNGKDWRCLADKLNIENHYVENWRQRHSNPAEQLLCSWQTKVSKATIGTLFDYLIEMEREDLAGML
ncbi:uncharacterized protein LOC122809069 isoform X2 [Protopterus annectens]|uniref:uncharacterized protein LOC122809069 isoform X2 n=1 Tax=Protopterus annectens TaxID=7888 RepID=UPI001CFAE072|nr:uncharacterized protein LOC122809069 isoform X2 [Protopterus annectens]